MSDTTFFVSGASVRYLKQRAERGIAGVPSSHLSEGVAAALGFNTYAALRASLAHSKTIEVPKPKNALFAARLRQLGYQLPEDLRVLPEFDRSYSPFKALPLGKSRSTRWTAWRNILVTAINAGLEQGLFGLQPGENWWPGGNPESHESVDHLYTFTMEGGHQGVVNLRVISGDELSFEVILNRRKSEVVPSLWSGLRDGDAVAQCWLERRLGVWIQDGGEDFKCKRALTAQLAALSIPTRGYADRGSFIM